MGEAARLTMLRSDTPALILAPMDGLSDAPMREVQGDIGAFTYAVAEFIRISANVPGKAVFYRVVPELCRGGKTPSGLPVHVQLLGGDPERLALSAVVACEAGATAIDINFGCPAKTVNNHDGGASLLKHPRRIREIVRAVRDAVPRAVPVSAKLRLGWDAPDAIFENAQMAADGGASWLTIHGRTREQGYQPPVLWQPIGLIRARLTIPVVANGDIWSLADFRRCRDETGCIHFMLGRGALANPFLSHQIAGELGMVHENEKTRFADAVQTENTALDWRPYLRRLIDASETSGMVSPSRPSRYLVQRLKQWLKIAALCGNFDGFEAVKHAQSVEELFVLLDGSGACEFRCDGADEKRVVGNHIRGEAGDHAALPIHEKLLKVP